MVYALKTGGCGRDNKSLQEMEESVDTDGTYITEGEINRIAFTMYGEEYKHLHDTLKNVFAAKVGAWPLTK